MQMGVCQSEGGQTINKYTKLNKQEDIRLWIGVKGEWLCIQNKSSNKRMYGEKETISGTLSQ